MIWVIIFFISFFVVTMLFSKYFWIKPHVYKENFINDKKEHKLNVNLPFLYYRLDDNLNTNEDSLYLNPTLHEITQYFPYLFQSADKYEDAHLLFFETLNRSDQNLSEMIKKNKRNEFVWPSSLLYLFTLNGIDQLVSKSAFAETMLNYSRFKSQDPVIPPSYLIRNPEERERLKKDFDKGIYILKRNLQRQQGFYLTSSLSDLIEKSEKETEYVVAQRFLNNPFLINGRKINMRVYVLVVINSLFSSENSFNNTCSWYAYENGFLYYTEKSYAYATEQERVITSGYIDREVYEKNPMTHDEFRLVLGPSRYKRLKENIKSQLRQVKEAYTQKFIQANKSIPGNKTALFGCDVAPDEDLNIKIMEFNKGPDISYKDERDKNVKYNLMIDMLHLLGLMPNIDFHQNRFRII